MEHYEDDETPALLQQLLRQNASEGFGPFAENLMAEPLYHAPSVTSQNSNAANRDFLPSVLNPTARGSIVQLTYEQAISAFEKYCEAAQNKSHLQERQVTIVAYDETGGQTSVHQINLTFDLDLKPLIQILQELIDQREREPSHTGKGKFLIRRIDVRSGRGSMDRCFPAIEGTVIEATQPCNPPSAQWVTWNCGGPMEIYWRYYRTAMQLGIGAGPSGPILKLRTVKCKDTYDSDEVGHIFNTISSQNQRTRRYSGGKPPGGGVFGNMSSGTVSKTRPQLNPVASAFKFGITIDESIGDTNTLSSTVSHKGKGVDVDNSGTNELLQGGEYNGGSKKVTVDTSTATEWKKAPIPDWNSLPPALNHNPGGYQVKPTSWSYWQRIGGDPETHKEFPLGHIPYPETPDIDLCDFLPGEQLDMKGSAATAMKAISKDEQPIMPILSAEEQAAIDQIMGQTRKEFNDARSFAQADDDIFISIANPNWDPNDRKNRLTKDEEVISSFTKNTSIPIKYQSQPAVFEHKPEPPSYVNAYYNRPTQPMIGTTSVTSPGTVSSIDSPVRFASPRATQSKSTFPSGGRARPFTPSQMTSFQPLKVGSRPGTPTLRYGGNTSSFAMPSTSIGFNAPPNTISRSRPSSPANSSQMVDQFGALNMANTQGFLRGHNNQLFVPGFAANQNTSTAHGLGNLPQNLVDWNFVQGESRYPFRYKFEFGGNGSNENGGGGF
ncbi:e21aa0a0-bc8a-4111-9306-4a724d053956-CDS [Sclerotinia trifoliorum]|uniref:E21aa0a0-bc8a-4111-9306-4a724d053956-CDS n=1 Tax=Sclerotinia trifoliorum TaxID=28548 RepID=A0A8H2VYL7_9HELO|nr:e21aa0a0-bc8a-4111-9306-4a724d053956-CDS [Sclerotinia trifoliorum]